MVRYLFTVYEDAEAPEGPMPVDLSTIAAARKMAVTLAGDTLREAEDSFWEMGEWRLDVADEHGLLLFSLHISAIKAAALRR